MTKLNKITCVREACSLDVSIIVYFLSKFVKEFYVEVFDLQIVYNINYQNVPMFDSIDKYNIDSEYYAASF